MPKSHTEEQFPLLLFVVGNQEVLQNNKRAFGKKRFDSITSGATAIITEWPNYLSSCWVTAFICGITLLTLTLMLTSCVSLQNHQRLPRCAPNYELDNKTIHLVHSSRQWSSKQIELLENITHSFPNYTIHLVIVQNHILTSPELVVTTNTQKVNKTLTKLITALAPHKVMTFDDMLEKHSNIIVTRTTYNNIFKDTPLFMKWPELNDQLRMFAIRILQMWQFGGLSYDLLEFKVSVPKKSHRVGNFAEKKLRKLIKYGHDTYETLGSDLVSVDHNGLHMECKTPCHAFFGKMLSKLRRARGRLTPKSLLSEPMMTYCSAGVIERLFCQNKNTIIFK